MKKRFNIDGMCFPKLKIRKNEERLYNSPWNIAAKFSVDMSFSVQDIAGMLYEYEADCHTGMDIDSISQSIWEYTSGYPFLISYICLLLDQSSVDDGCNWSVQGVSQAVRELLKEPNTLFDDMVKHLTEYPELSRMIQNILFGGKNYPYNPYNHAVNIGVMFGFLGESDGSVCITNRIFETQLYNYFLSEEITGSVNSAVTLLDKNQFVHENFSR